MKETYKEWLKDSTESLFWAMDLYRFSGDKWYRDIAEGYLQRCRREFQAALTGKYIYD